MKFFIKDFLINVIKSAENCGLITFTEKSLMENVIFCAVLKAAIHNVIKSCYFQKNEELFTKKQQQF